MIDRIQAIYEDVKAIRARLDALHRPIQWGLLAQQDEIEEGDQLLDLKTGCWECVEWSIGEVCGLRIVRRRL